MDVDSKYAIKFYTSILLNLDCCLFVCLFVRFVENNGGLENLLINVVYLFICGDYQESKQFS